MPDNIKVDFTGLKWDESAPGIRSKSFIRDGKKIRLLELRKDLEHPEWCETGHIGFIVKGEIEIEFADKTILFSKGDGLIIASGKDEKHIPKPVSDTVVMFLVEDVD